MQIKERGKAKSSIKEFSPNAAYQEGNQTLEN